MADQQQRGRSDWSPGQYLKFADQRLRPALELLDRIPIEHPHTIYDLGCGTGQMTAMIAERWPQAQVYGIDNSVKMLERAVLESQQVIWRHADIADWQPETPPDLIYSNAALHWIAGHDRLFPRLLGMLAPGGVLAVQMPLSWPAPSHRLMRDTLADGGAAGAALGSAELRETMARKWVEAPAFYYDLLAADAAHLDIWTTEYLQVLEGPDPVLEWVKGTGLRPILDGLEDSERSRFLEVYAARLRETYPMRSDGRTLYPFQRLFIISKRREIPDA